MKRLLLALGFLAGCDGSAQADAVPGEVRAAVAERLGESLPEIAHTSVATTPMDGVYKVSLENGQLLYTNSDASYLIAGEMFQVTDSGIQNLAEQERAVERREQLQALDTEDMIVFSPEGETRGVINVFTDVDCGYCRKLHQEVPELNERGVEVRYLAFPRAGVGSESYRRIATAWCADNPQQAITKLKQGENIPIDVCENNPVAEQYQLGQTMGVRGTPALVMMDGTMVPGYRPADELMALLDLE